MRLDIVTLFPGICYGPLNESILKRAQENGIVEVGITNLRDFTHDKHRTADDRPYGGGAGMVLKPEPLFEAINSIRTPKAKVLLLSPQGATFCQRTARRLSTEQHLILICGHYEGVDERIRQALIDEEISIGDYILTNGSLAAVVVADALIRLLPGALGCAESSEEESFGDDNLLDYPQYTRPLEFHGMRVPDVLLSGNHNQIAEWRQEQKLARTVARRPDLLRQAMETENEYS